jgi:hypothetical protein
MKITTLSYYKEFLINRKIWAQKITQIITSMFQQGRGMN